MRKKFIIFSLLLVMLLCSIYPIRSYAHSQTNASADNTYDEGKIVARYPDGSYIVCTTSISQPTKSFLDATAAYKNITSSRTYNYYNSSNTLIWYINLTGTFKYNGSTASCTHSDINVKSYSSNWALSKCSSSHSGSTAIGTATAKQYNGSTVVNTINKVIYLTCSPNGTFS